MFADEVARYLPPARQLGMGTIHATDPATTITKLAQMFRQPQPDMRPRRAVRRPSGLQSTVCDAWQGLRPDTCVLRNDTNKFSQLTHITLD